MSDSPCGGDISVWTLAERVRDGLPVSSAAHRDIATAATAETDDDECVGCGAETHREFGHDRTPLCHSCAHLFAEALGRIVLCSVEMRPAEDTELEAMERAAKAATPGPWEVGEDERECAATLRARPVRRGSDPEPAVDVIIPFGRAYSDARHIASCSPDRILRLLARVRTAEHELRHARERLDAIEAAAIEDSEREP